MNSGQTRRSKNYLGRQRYRSYTAKGVVKMKLDPTQQSQEYLLAGILSDPRAAKAVMDEARRNQLLKQGIEHPTAEQISAVPGDLRFLDGYDVRDLTDIPHVGQAKATKIADVFALVLQLSDQDEQGRKMA